MSFVNRLIDVSFLLGQGTFIESGANQVRLSGLRVSAKVIKAGGPSMGTAQLEIYGMTLSLMNQLSTLGLRPTLFTKNILSVFAGDSGSNLGLVFVGNIMNAWMDAQSAPEVAFRVEAATGGWESLLVVPASSFKGSMDVAVALAGLAAAAGIPFSNFGVKVTLSPSYYSGSAREQMLAIVNDAGIQWNGLDNGRLEIWPAGGARGGLVPLVSPSTGMIGYPSYTSQGIAVKTLYNPAIGFGGAIEVDSSLKPARGPWNVYALDYALDSQVPRGKWESNIQAARPGYLVVSSGR